MVIQARMGSSRMPGKILAPLCGRPMLWHVVRRLRAAASELLLPVEIIVATTDDPADDATAACCQQLNVPCFRGSRDDVLARYLAATADLGDADVVVRATADNPLYCPRRSAHIIETHLASGADYTCIAGLSYVVPEVFRAGALRVLAHGTLDAYCREHVTPGFRRPGHNLRVEQLPATWEGLRPELRLTVDTTWEHGRIAALAQQLPRPLHEASLAEIYAALEAPGPYPAGAASPDAPFQDLRVGIVGLGSIGARHCRNLESLGVRQRVAVRRAAGANAAFPTPRGVEVVHSVREAIERGLDAALVCNPTCQHLQTAAELAEGGVPVLIEKPLGHDPPALARLAAARERGATVGVAYCMRHHPAYRLARTLLLEGQIGRPLYAKTWFESYLPDWHPWEDFAQSYAARAELGGGALPTLDHELDFLNWCLGDPQVIAAHDIHTGALPIDAPDLAFRTLRYAGGVTAMASVCLARRDHRRGFEIVGEQRSMRFCMQAGLLELLVPGERAVTLWHAPRWDLNLMYREMLREFLTAVCMGQEAPIPLAAGIAAWTAGQAVTSVPPCRLPTNEREC